MEKEEKTDRCILKKKKRERLNTFKDLAVRVSWEDKMKEVISSVESYSSEEIKLELQQQNICIFYKVRI